MHLQDALYLHYPRGAGSACAPARSAVSGARGCRYPHESGGTSVHAGQSLQSEEWAGAAAHWSLEEGGQYTQGGLHRSSWAETHAKQRVGI
eukprot:1158184-Pelagomonas_calceolata.AAC.1